MVDVSGKVVIADAQRLRRGCISDAPGNAGCDPGGRGRKGRRADGGAARGDRRSKKEHRTRCPCATRSGWMGSASRFRRAKGPTGHTYDGDDDGRGETDRVEMEALCGVSAGLLAVYDMCKAIDRGMQIERQFGWCSKEGGRSGAWQQKQKVTRAPGRTPARGAIHDLETSQATRWHTASA